MLKKDNIPKISVIITFYKGEKYIKQSVDSVLKQPYENLEIVLVNDGSPSGDELCASIASQSDKIKYFKKANGGAGDARNFGIDKATGDYVAFLDQDDVWIKNFLDNDTVQRIFEGGDATCFSMYAANHDLSRGQILNYEDKVFPDGGIKAMSQIWRSHCCIFFKRKVIVENNIYSPKTKRNEDEVFRHKFMYVSKKVTCINKPLFAYRNNPASETHKRTDPKESYHHVLASWEDFLNWANSNFPQDKALEKFIKNMICIYSLEAIEKYYFCGGKKANEEDFKKTIPCFDILSQYQQYVTDQYVLGKIDAFFKKTASFRIKQRISGIIYSISTAFSKISFIANYRFSKRFPLTLDENIIQR